MPPRDWRRCRGGRSRWRARDRCEPRTLHRPEHWGQVSQLRPSRKTAARCAGVVIARANWRPLTRRNLWPSAPVPITPAGCERTAPPSAGATGDTEARRPRRCWTSVSLRLAPASITFAGLQENGVAICWGTYSGAYIERWSPPRETFVAIFSMAAHTCGIRPDGSSHCWNNGLRFQAPQPARRGGLVSLSRGALCDLDISGDIICLDWYQGPDYDVLPGEKLRYMGGSWDVGYRGFICGIRPDGSAACSPVSSRLRSGLVHSEDTVDAEVPGHWGRA